MFTIWMKNLDGDGLSVLITKVLELVRSHIVLLLPSEYVYNME
jgi:hypothetical protein